MELPRVIIKDFSDFLEGKEVAALPSQRSTTLHEGEKVIAFKDSIAGTTNLTVPSNELHRAIGVDAVVVGVEPGDTGKPTTAPNLLLKVKKC